MAALIAAVLRVTKAPVLSRQATAVLTATGAGELVLLYVSGWTLPAGWALAARTAAKPVPVRFGRLSDPGSVGRGCLAMFGGGPAHQTAAV